MELNGGYGDELLRQMLVGDSIEDVEPGGVTPNFWEARDYSIAEFVARPPKRWILENVIGDQDFVLLYGESGHGKTHVALDMAFALSRGHQFAGAFGCHGGARAVAYATGEGLGGLAGRLRTVAAYYNQRDANIRILTDVPQLFDGAPETTVRGFVDYWRAQGRPLDVLILDTLHNATAGGDENSAQDASVVQRSLRYLRDELSCAVVLVHHANKSGSAERGSSALRAAMDTVLRSQKNNSQYTLSCEKLKDAESWPSVAFSLEKVLEHGEELPSVRVNWLGSVAGSEKITRKDAALIYLQAEAPGGAWYTAAQVSQQIGMGDSKAIYEYLSALVNAGAVESQEVRPRLFRASKQSVSAKSGLVSTDYESSQ